jgi:hypothetical protein
MSPLGRTPKTACRARHPRLLTLSTLPQESRQLHQAVDHETRPEIHQCPEVKFEGMMPGRFRQIGVEGKVQAITDQYSNQVL